MPEPTELDALARAERAVQATPQDADAQGRLSTLLIEAARAAGRTGAAPEPLYRRALVHLELAAQLRPGSAQPLRYSGLAHRELGELAEAERVLQAAARAAPEDPDIAVDLAFARQSLGDAARAIATYDAVLAKHPEHPNAHASLALSLLGAGDYERGWPEYEWRLRLPAHTIYRPYPFAFWRGEPLEGRRILICSEQGIGDEVMFASCYQEVIDRAGECVIECSARLVDLFARSFPRARILARNLSRMPDWSALPRFDFHVPCGSLPLQLRRSAQDFPGRRAYLAPDQTRVRYWRSRVEALGPGLKVGLAWTGGLSETLGAARSLRLEDLEPVLRVENARFVSLQFEQTGADPVWWPQATRSVDESAALVYALDLVITVTTAIAHVAGAVGAPLWILIPKAATWRYGWSGDKMPWYPQARIFRGAGDTTQLAQRLETELRLQPQRLA